MVRREDEPILPAEQLLRRFNCSAKQLQQLKPGGLVPHNKFMPRKPRPPDFPGDIDGLSVNREACLGNSIEMVTRLRCDEGRPLEQGIARVPVSALAPGGMTLKPDPLTAGPPGHCVIPELNCNAAEDDQERLALVLHKASACEGVFRAGSGVRLL